MQPTPDHLTAIAFALFLLLAVVGYSALCFADIWYHYRDVDQDDSMEN